MSDIQYPESNRPEGFTQQGLGWQPWLAPVAEAELTEEQRGALIGQFRLKSPYFRLLVRNPEALEARTLTDQDIFYNVTSGLPRAEREIAASAASRINGCVYCASVHTDRATKESGREEDVQKLLDDGVEADLGQPWSAIAQASAALTETPSAFDAGQIDALREAGLDDADIVDVINGAAFFNWANRLMLSLGEPSQPR
ncbi:alkylhydroperoxidase domain protein [Yaniella halotolerans]|uniref:alkylhydroperoxidase domain protein n=1 Tax=Yaniella halotolerans TaxID=225453 RepID=UPI0003FFE07D|nr:alkylhydroperoxidase domain protein [Yaniella halotolerans]